MILSSGAKYNQINFFKNYVSGNARKIGVTVIWWFTADRRRCHSGRGSYARRTDFIDGVRMSLMCIFEGDEE